MEIYDTLQASPLSTRMQATAPRRETQLRRTGLTCVRMLTGSLSEGLGRTDAWMGEKSELISVGSEKQPRKRGGEAVTGQTLRLV